MYQGYFALHLRVSLLDVFVVHEDLISVGKLLEGIFMSAQYPCSLLFARIGFGPAFDGLESGSIAQRFDVFILVNGVYVGTLSLALPLLEKFSESVLDCFYLVFMDHDTDLLRVGHCTPRLFVEHYMCCFFLHRWVLELYVDLADVFCGFVNLIGVGSGRDLENLVKVEGHRMSHDGEKHRLSVHVKLYLILFDFRHVVFPFLKSKQQVVYFLFSLACCQQTIILPFS